MPEPTTHSEAIEILIRNTLELYQQMEVTNIEIARQDVAAIKLLGREASVFRIGDRYLIGEPA